MVDISERGENKGVLLTLQVNVKYAGKLVVYRVFKNQIHIYYDLSQFSRNIKCHIQFTSTSSLNDATSLDDKSVIACSQ